MKQVEGEAQRIERTITDTVITILREYFAKSPREANMARVMGKLEAIEFEIAKSRGVMLRCFDMQGHELSDEVIAEAGKDATAYIEQRKQSS